MFIIKTNPVPLPEGVTHISTSWQVSADTTFEGTSLLEDIDQSTTMLYELVSTLPLTEDDIYYVRTKYYFSNNTETYWTRPSIITQDSEGFSISTVIINTPVITVDVSSYDSPLGGFKITGNPISFYSGSGTHESTDWKIETTDGDTVWKKIKDKHNLTKIRIPTNTLKPNKSYLIKVRYNSNVNVSSNYARLGLNTRKELEVELEGTVYLTDNADMVNKIITLETALEETLRQLTLCTTIGSLEIPA